MKRDALDAVFSDLIREAWDWTCARCLKEFPDRKGRDVHCSHFFSRSFNSMRWFPDNAVCLCATCHDHIGKRPDEHTAMIRRVLGDVAYERNRERMWNKIVRYKADDKKAMRKHYAAELERIKAMRRVDGVTGYVAVASYD